MMCAPTRADRVGRDHAKAPGRENPALGGGRCNFTNMHCTPQAFIRGNPPFANISSLPAIPSGFIELVTRMASRGHEKTLGQLFCDLRPAIVAMPRGLMQKAVWIAVASTLYRYRRDGCRFTAEPCTRPTQQTPVTRTQSCRCFRREIHSQDGRDGRAYEIGRRWASRHPTPSGSCSLYFHRRTARPDIPAQHTACACDRQGPRPL